MDDKNILQSWKEISSYLERSERTCRRWEIEFGLPIHRMDGSHGSSVFAYKDELDRWLEDLLHKKAIASKKSFIRSPKKLIIILSVSAIVVSILIIAAWKMVSTKPGVTSISSNPTLAVLYFRNNTEEESLSYLRKGLCDLLIRDLSQSKYLNVLPEDRLFQILRRLKLLDTEYYDTSDLDRFAEYAQVDNIVFGNIVRSGDKYVVHTTLRKISSSENIAIERVDCANEAEFFSLADKISKRIKAELIVPPDMIVGDIDKEMESITTSSIEAYKYFIEARKFHRKGQSLESVSFLEKAVNIDPDFAMAYRLLAMCYGRLPGYEDKSANCMKKAFESRHHVSERERLLIEAHYTRSQGEKTWGEAIEAFKELLRIYPDDYYAIVHLGSLYRSIEDWGRCIETLQQITHIYYFSSHFAHLRRALCARGDYADALKLARSIPVDLFPYQYPYQLTLDLFLHGKLDLALHEAEIILDRSEDWYPVLRLEGDIYLLKDDWIRAEECYNRCLEARDLDINRLRHHNLALTRLSAVNLSSGKFDEAMNYIRQGIEEVSRLGEIDWLCYLHMNAAYIYYKKGDIDRAAEECRKALDSAWKNASVRGKIETLHLLGLLALETNKWNQAHITANEIKNEVENWLNPKLMRYYHHLKGHIDLKENNLEDAIANFEQTVALLPYQYDPEGDEHAPFYDSLALAFYRIKDFENALKWYEKILRLTSGRIYYGDIYAKSFYMLGRIYEEKGWKGKAIDSYKTFLDLWSDADPNIPQLEEARLHFAALSD